MVAMLHSLPTSPSRCAGRSLLFLLIGSLFIACIISMGIMITPGSQPRAEQAARQRWPQETAASVAGGGRGLAAELYMHIMRGKLRRFPARMMRKGRLSSPSFAEAGQAGNSYRIPGG